MSVRDFAVVRDGVVVNSVLWDGVSEWSPSEGDAVDPQGASFAIGWAYADGVFVEPPREPLTWEGVRYERDRLLAASDWTQVADAPVDAAAWAVYRQALRDVPQDFASPDDVVWPVAP